MGGMVMPPIATFDYVAVVPDARLGGRWQMSAELRRPLAPTGNEESDSRLVGYTPSVTVDAWAIILTASTREWSAAAQASFPVDCGLLELLQPGDRLNLVRIANANLGLSVVRGDRLMAAFGAISSVDLGPTVRVGSHPGGVRFTVGEVSALVSAGASAEIAGYIACVVCPDRDGMPPGEHACSAVALKASGWPPVAQRCTGMFATEAGWKPSRLYVREFGDQ
jgi:hypothetical protein